MDDPYWPDVRRRVSGALARVEDARRSLAELQSLDWVSPAGEAFRRRLQRLEDAAAVAAAVIEEAQADIAAAQLAHVVAGAFYRAAAGPAAGVP